MGKLALSISTVEREQNWSLVILQSLVALYLLLHIGVSVDLIYPTKENNGLPNHRGHL